MLHFQAVDEAKYLKSIKDDHLKQLHEFHVKLDEHSLTEMNQWKTLEDEIQSNMNTILSSDDTRKAVFQLAYDEDQQIIAVSLVSFCFIVITYYS